MSASPPVLPSATLPRSRWWIVYAVLLGIVGGVLIYFAIKYDDQRRADHCLVAGIISGILSIVVPVALFSVAGVAGMFD